MVKKWFPPLVFFIVFSACANSTKIEVVTSISVSASIVKEVGGNRVECISLVTGAENPHKFSLRPRDLKKITASDVIFTIGFHMDDWLPQDGSKKSIPLYDEKTKIIDNNPHYWLDPDNGIEMARIIKNNLSKIAPWDSTYFKRKFQVFVDRVSNIKPPDILKGKKVISIFPAFDYLFSFLDINDTMVVLDTPGKRPSPKRIIDAINLIKKENIEVIITAPFSDYGITETIVKETGAKVVTLIPLTGLEENINDYISLLREDISRLEDGFIN
ncbi:metal ABC transporter substrate-binding protein [candidate division WOR-3 bacterium]|nr:metal ABC transporter substrate-binding protein [candidate division WOR-3 bacterium]